MIWGIVPIKKLDDAKRRLAPELTPDQRRSLCLAMLHDVLAALHGASSLAGIVVVTPDEEAAAVAGRFGARLLPEPTPGGYVQAAELAAAKMKSARAAGIVCVPGDVPLVRAQDIDTMAAAVAASPSVAVAPSRDEDGTNALAMAPPGVLPFCFGPDSFARHWAVAKEQGLPARVLRLPGLALDIDTPEDLRHLSGLAPDGETGRWLEANGNIGRMAENSTNFS